MDAHYQTKPDHHSIVLEIMEGLREYQMILVDSAGKVFNSETAVQLYNLASEHAALEAELRDMVGGSAPRRDAPKSAFVNQIRALGTNLKSYGDFSKSHHILCEVIRTEDRMLRRITALIDQVTDLRLKRRLVRQLDHLLNIRDNLSRFRDCQPPPRSERFSLTRKTHPR